MVDQLDEDCVWRVRSVCFLLVVCEPLLPPLPLQIPVEAARLLVGLPCKVPLARDVERSDSLQVKSSCDSKTPAFLPFLTSCRILVGSPSHG